MPLARDVLIPVLLGGARNGEPESLRWLVRVRLDPAMRTDVIAPELHEESRFKGLLAAALARNFRALDMWRAVFNFELAPAEWGTHHLAEGVLILSERECFQSLERARRVLDRAPAGALDEEDLADIDQLASALRDYCAWKDTGATQSYAEWCHARGRRYSWSVPIYYER
jgi:hypothetical protein